MTAPGAGRYAIGGGTNDGWGTMAIRGMTTRQRRGATGTTGSASAPPFARLLALALLCAWGALTLLASAGTITGAAARGVTDFFTFLDSAARWRAALDPYRTTRLVDLGAGPQLAHTNLNHPLTIPLFAPLLALPPAAAFLLWDALGLLAFLTALALARRALDWSPTPTGWLAAVALIACCPGLIYGLQLGQWGALLALPVVALWCLLRDPRLDRDRRVLLLAGALCGVLLALKPFLLPLAAFFLPRRRRAGLLALGAGGLGASLLALPFVGPAAYPAWLAALRGVSWYDHGMNIGLFGLLNRLAAPPATVGWLLQGGAALLGAALVRRARAACDDTAARDRTIGALLLLGILGSPLGWLYYTPLLLPALLPALAAWPRLGRGARAALGVTVALLWAPHILLTLLPQVPPMELTLRALPTYGLLALLAFLLRPQPPATATRAALRREQRSCPRLRRFYPLIEPTPGSATRGGSVPARVG